MNLRVLLLVLALFGGLLATPWTLVPSARAEEELTPIAQIKSPDVGETFTYGETKQRTLYWNEKKQELSARVTFSDAKYNSGQINEETLDFRMPGVRYDKDKKEFYVVLAQGNQRLLFAVRKKAFMGSSIVPVRNAVIRVIKTGASVNVVADIYKADEVATAEKAEKEAERKSSGSDDSKIIPTKSLFDK